MQAVDMSSRIGEQEYTKTECCPPCQEAEKLHFLSVPVCVVQGPNYVAWGAAGAGGVALIYYLTSGGGAKKAEHKGVCCLGVASPSGVSGRTVR